MRHRTHRTDHNQADIVSALRKIGCTVQIIGRPVDLLVGYRALNFLLEVKNKDGLNKKTDAQNEFFRIWRGQVRKVETPKEAIQVVTESYK